MRLLTWSAASAVLATVTLALSAEAASARVYRHYVPSYGGWPYWQGEPTDRLPIWRYGHYQGNDPDNFIRSQLMRDPQTSAK